MCTKSTRVESKFYDRGLTTLLCTFQLYYNLIDIVSREYIDEYRAT